MKILLVSACVAATLNVLSTAWAQDQYPAPPQGQDQYPAPPDAQFPPPPTQDQSPPAQGNTQYPPPQEGQYPAPAPQYPYPPPEQGQYGYPPPQAQYPYPPPAQYGYAEPPAYAGPAAPVAPPGAVWVGEPGECLYAAGVVYWCAPGVAFTGFPAWWDFVRYPVVNIAPAVVIDPVWFEGWRRIHPGFAFRGRIATIGERRAFFERREEFIRNRERFRERGREERRRER